MASMGGSGYLDPDPLVRAVKNGGYTNKILQAICSTENLRTNGVKAELQNRIIERIRHYQSCQDVSNFNRLKEHIINPKSIMAGGMGSAASSAVNSPAPPNNPPYMNGSSNVGAYNAVSMSGYRIIGTPRIEFKYSPYYTIEEQLGSPALCEVMTHHRHTAKLVLRVSDYPVLSRVVREPTLRVMVFSAAEGLGKQDISFPHQSEIKVNGGEVKANLRGLKNKPGSTRPVDITQELRLNGPAAYQNTVEMTYALTSKKFYLVIYVVRAIPVTDLVKKLENGRRITETSVINDSKVVNKARDADIVATASVLSLKCPLSTLRIDLPCRSITCRHNQCFDATSYLQLQEQGPTWLCPICNNSAPFDTLAVDEYVKNILKSVPKSADQVTIHPNGKWDLHNRSGNSGPKGVASQSDSDDDIIEITKSGDAVRMSAPSIRRPTVSQLPVSREASSSVAPRDSIGSTSNKRPAAAIIDLTSSGDEDDLPLARPAKKHQNANGYYPPAPVTPYRSGPPHGY